MWTGDVIEPKDPIVSEDGKVGFVNANRAGIFVPNVEHWKNVKEGQVIGNILDPLEGVVLEEAKAPISGMLFTLREYPVVSCGSLIARLLGDSDGASKGGVM